MICDVKGPNHPTNHETLLFRTGKMKKKRQQRAGHPTTPVYDCSRYLPVIDDTMGQTLRVRTTNEIHKFFHLGVI